MYMGSEYIFTKYQRPSKLGQVHEYERKKTIVIFRCDSCGTEFKREKKMVSPARFSNNFYHVCGNCDHKRFAQSKGVESKHIWDMPVSSLKNISQL